MFGKCALILTLGIIASGFTFAAPPILTLPPDVLGLIFNHVPRPQILAVSQVSTQFRNGVRKTRNYQAHKIWAPNAWPDYRLFEGRFVIVPAGFLPDGTMIRKFGASRVPFLRKDWLYFMGEPPAAVPLDERATWFSDCPNCPVTHVTWTNADGTSGELQELVKIVNLRLGALGCLYDLPTYELLYYMLRADQTGRNTDPFSRGVDERNVHGMVLHSGNAQTDRVPRVGQTGLNAFGLQISGLVWKLTKTPFDPLRPELGQMMAGGSWKHGLEFAKSDVKQASYGEPSDSVGFILVRDCGWSEPDPVPIPPVPPIAVEELNGHVGVPPPPAPRIHRRIKLLGLAAKVIRKIAKIGYVFMGNESQ